MPVTPKEKPEKLQEGLDAKSNPYSRSVGPRCKDCDGLLDNENRCWECWYDNYLENRG